MASFRRILAAAATLTLSAHVWVRAGEEDEIDWDGAVEESLKHMDKNKDGKMSRKELRKALQATVDSLDEDTDKEVESKDVERYFKLYDKDNDGNLDKAELKVMLQSMDPNNQNAGEL
eukprot:TRINITY_DN2517_c1_g1_i1.p1 TRINITY_DN2517_c1_g1~~TRINITY_DN2517_c1_g1_i1.p1  ORF type:complete len:118 (+),score=31.15 TRINITY_DN2517_c1_g1_i1:64-417(+)